MACKYLLIFSLICISLCLGFRMSDDYRLWNNKNNESEFPLKNFFHDVNEESIYADKDISNELTTSIIRSMDICRDKMEEASKKLDMLLDQYSVGKHSESLSTADEEDSDVYEDNELEMFNAKLDPFFEQLGQGLKEVKIENEGSTKEMFKGRRHTSPNYVKEFEGILHVFNHACNSLPNSLPKIHIRSPRNTENMVEKLALSLTKWTERWMDSIETKFDTFIDTCIASKHCKSYLEKVLHNLVNVLKTQKNAFGESSSNVLQELLQELSFKGSPSVETLTYLERLALGFSGSFDDYNKKEENAFHMAEDIDKPIGGHSPWEGVPQRLLHADNALPSSFLKLHIKGNNPSKNAELEIDSNLLVSKVPDTFLSLALGSRLIQEHWKGVKNNLPKFLNIASALSPSLLRVGGSAANFLTFDPSEIPKAESENILPKAKTKIDFPKENHPKFKNKNIKEIKSDNSINQYSFSENMISPNFNHPKYAKKTQISVQADLLHLPHTKGRHPHDHCDPQYNAKEFTNFTMSETEWKFLIDIGIKLNWTLLFDLNQFLRDPEGNWDPSNARLLLKDVQAERFPLIWQLGNEPNSYQYAFNRSISPEQAAEDYKVLKKELSEANQLVSLVGPDTTRPKHTLVTEDDEIDFGEDSVKFLLKFLEQAGDLLDAVTWHQYYVDGRTATLENFISSQIMNVFPRQLSKIVSLRDQKAIGKPIWITETASAWGGGAPGLSNRFVGGFPWLDKLGAAALGGASLVFRQTLYGGCYALTDRDLNPYPDFWVSVLHKQLVGQGVLLPRVRLAPSSLRIYAHCLNTKHELYKKGAVVVFGMNLSESPLYIDLFGKEFKDSRKYRFELTSPHGDLTSRHILLNGKLLELTSDDQLPRMIPKEESTNELEFAPLGMIFWVLPDVASSVC